MNAVILANGVSNRFINTSQDIKGIEKNKLLLVINNKCVIEHSIDTFLHTEWIKKIIVVTSNKDIISHLKLKYNKKIFIVDGDKTRTSSLLKSLKSITSNKFIVHDGSRPYVSKKVLENIKNNYLKFNCIVPILNVYDALKEVKHNYVVKKINRNSVKRVQTPQMVSKSLLTGIINSANFKLYKNYDDESELILSYFPHEKIKCIEGSVKCIKITTYDDYKYVKYLMKDIE